MVTFMTTVTNIGYCFYDSKYITQLQAVIVVSMGIVVSVFAVVDVVALVGCS